MDPASKRELLHSRCAKLLHETMRRISTLLRNRATSESQRIEDSDAAVQYSSPDTLSATSSSCSSPQCDDRWRTEQDDDSENTVHYASTNATTLSLNFRGASVSFYGRATSNGGHGLIAVDGGTPNLIAFLSDQEHETRMIFLRDALDPEMDHTLSLQALGDGEIGVDYFEISGAQTLSQ
ncbi:hypothetical protein EXIGLDRAFT_91534 [Exidia glandulosa HHB12029]|uniref:Uncharacterized protein n=1 Tax=Exidia glandulosa HHB12029 TaxID=1314781 RepID=A0A165HBG6_EXIGL|nr:hypothetical protein EXIGLDRAFT_91534 [Exidia glandulosa HHB12029]